MTDLVPEGRAYGVPKRREEIVALLTEAYSRNDLEQGELERRLALAEQARSIEELEAIVADFPPEVSEGRKPTALTPKELERQVGELDCVAAPTRFTLVGDQHVSVMPSDARVLRSVSVIGDKEFDLRGLAGEPGIFLLKVVSLIGDTAVIVPRGTEVQSRMLCLLGDQSHGKGKDGFLTRLARKLRGVPERPEKPPGAPGPTVVLIGHKLIGDTRILEV